MQYQMSSASAPTPVLPQQPIAPGPAIVHPGPRKPRRTARWVIPAILVVAGIAAWQYWNTARQAKSPSQPAFVVRTATVASGDLHRTVRLAGTIVAERFAAIIAPQIRGSRNDRGRDAGNASVANVAGASDTPALSGATGTSSGRSSLGAKRGTTNRFTGSSGGSSGGSGSAGTGSGGASDVMGSSGLGSTASSLPPNGSGGGGGGGGTVTGGGGGGRGRMAGGMSDFALVLMDVAPPGSHVKKGDVVAEFDRQYQMLRLDDYKAAVIQLDANIKKLESNIASAKEAHSQVVRAAKADLEKARLDMKTLEVLSAIEAEQTKLALEQAEARYKQVQEEAKLVEASQKAQLRAAQIDRDQAKIELQRATNNVDKLVMKAPINGIVVMQSIFRGGQFGQIQKGDQVYSGMFFMAIVDPTAMIMDATVNQVDAESVRIGQKAAVRLDAYSDIELPATVFSVGAMTKPGGMRASYFREVPVRLKLDKMDARVIPDLSGSADVVIASEKEATVAPLAGVFRDPGKDARPYVFLQTPEGWKRKEVDLGIASNIAVVVRSGLKKGDVIAAQRVSEARM